MKTIRTMTALGLLALVALVALAVAATSDTQFEADGGMSLSGYRSIDLVAYDGSATVTLIDSGEGSVVRTHYLRESVPRTFGWYSPGDGIDSLYVDLTTASEVIATPR